MRVYTRLENLEQFSNFKNRRGITEQIYSEERLVIRIQIYVMKDSEHNNIGSAEMHVVMLILN